VLLDVTWWGAEQVVLVCVGILLGFLLGILFSLDTEPT
jgi:hypothetical protein